MLKKIYSDIRKYHWILVLVSLLAFILMCDLRLYRDRYDIDRNFGFKHPILWRYQFNERDGSHSVIARSGLNNNEQVYIWLRSGGKALVGIPDVDIDIDMVIEAQAASLQSRISDLELIQPPMIVPGSDGMVATALFRESNTQDIRVTVAYLGRGIYGVARTFYGASEKLNQEADAVVSSMYYSVYPTNMR